jgi:hypothetical protein
VAVDVRAKIPLLTTAIQSESKNKNTSKQFDTQIDGYIWIYTGCIRSLSPLSSGLIGWLGSRFPYIRMK